MKTGHDLKGLIKFLGRDDWQRGFDQSELDKEITRIIEASRGNPTRNEILVGILKFIRHAKTLGRLLRLYRVPIRSQPSRPKYCISHFVIKALAISTVTFSPPFAPAFVVS